MIDVEWLRSLRFESSSGRILGLAGIGSQYIVFVCERGDGERFVLKVPNAPHLGWALREVPPHLSDTPLYDLDRLNAKLLRLVGNEWIDGMAECYNDLYASMLERLHRGGVDGLRTDLGGDEDLAEAVAFLLHTPGMTRRLDDLARLDFEGADPGEVVLINEMSALIEDTRGNLASWAREMQVSLATLPCPDWAPSRLQYNPLFIWGAAVLDGFFGRDDLARAIEFIEAHFGRLSQRDDALVLGEQAFALQTLAACSCETEGARNFVTLCSLAGFVFVDAQGVEMPAERVVPPAPERTGSVDASPTPRLPRLPHPCSVAPFSGEGRLDPFCRTPAFRVEAERRIAGFVARQARRAHTAGLAVSLPVDGDGNAGRTPWRSVARLQQPLHASAEWQRRVSRDRNGPPSAGNLLHLLQRALVSLSALDPAPAQAWDDAAEALESFGYLALGTRARVDDVPQWKALYEVGQIAAKLHAMRCLHGDLHPGNFMFGSDGSLTSMFDLGRTGFQQRELTPLERAGDLTALKRHCDALGWEAAKAGYRDGAPDDAEAVLALFPADASTEHDA